MTAAGHNGRYGALAQLLHWVTALLVFALVGIAIYMVQLPLGPAKIEAYNLHKSVGVTVLVLTLLRFGWRQVSPPPALPQDMANWERVAAYASHALLYGILLVQPLVGIIHSWSANFPVVIYGWFTLPNLTPPDESLKNLLAAMHSWLGWGLVAVVVLHVAAALRHHFLLRDEVLLRMLPFGRAASSQAEET